MIDDARRYRGQESLVGKGGGVVVFFQGEVQGWVNQLRNPEHWQPGCIAVDEQGRTWTTIAGSEREEGREAFRQGLNDADNPYPNGTDEAMDWFDGLSDEENGA
ncbi:hypothetical protein ABH945_007216 [Paraburkholderia sp. GAS333]